MASIDNYESVYTLTDFLNECPETQIINEQSNENEAPEICDENAQVVVFDDQNSGQITLNKKDAELLFGEQRLDELTRKGQNCFIINKSDHQLNAQSKKAIEVEPDQSPLWKSILKKTSEKVIFSGNESKDSYDVEMPLNDNEKLTDTSSTFKGGTGCELSSDAIEQHEVNEILVPSNRSYYALLRKTVNENSSTPDNTPASDAFQQKLNENSTTTSNKTCDTGLQQVFFCELCGDIFSNFDNLRDHTVKEHYRGVRNINTNSTDNINTNSTDNINCSKQPQCTIISTKTNGTVIKVQDKKSTRIVVDYDGTDDKKQQPDLPQPKINILQDEISINQPTEYCHICHRLFYGRRERVNHLRKVHSIVPHVNRFIKCLDCGKDFRFRSEFRDHLQVIHKLNMAPLKLSFPTRNGKFRLNYTLYKEDFKSVINYIMKCTGI